MMQKDAGNVLRIHLRPCGFLSTPTFINPMHYYRGPGK